MSFGQKAGAHEYSYAGNWPICLVFNLKLMHAGMDGWVEVFTLNRVMENMKNVSVYGHICSPV